MKSLHPRHPQCNPSKRHSEIKLALCDPFRAFHHAVTEQKKFEGDRDRGARMWRQDHMQRPGTINKMIELKVACPKRRRRRLA